MAPNRKVVADSDDSDDSDDDNDNDRGEVIRPEAETGAEALSLVDSHGGDQREALGDGHHHPVSTPQAEPLSPDHQPPSHHHHHDGGGGQSSNSTSQSAFARIAAAQQEKVLQQSRLIENIVRQSQRVVVDIGNGSGGDGSGSSSRRWLDSEGGGSGTSGQGRVVLDLEGLAAQEEAAGAGQQQARGTRSEWDIPSSPEIPANDPLTTLRGQRSGTEELWDQPALPPAKRQRVSMHNTLGDSSSSGKGSGFYVAPSNLTTMQKLEYQRINVPQANSNSNSLTGENTTAVRTTPTGQQQKSSCATTIAYTTPSRYASSGGRYPWESSVVIAEDGPDQEAIQIPSSPNIIAQEPPSSVPVQEPELPEAQGDTTREVESPKMEELPPAESPIRQGLRSSARKRQPVKKILDDEDLSAPESPVRQGIRSSARKRKPAKKILDEEEEDELAAHDDPWAFNAVDDHEEVYKPRPSRRRTKAASPSRDRTNRRISKANDEHEEDELALPDIEEPRSARGRKRQVEASDEEDEPEETVEVPKKKRGRPKKKKPVEEAASEEDFANDEDNAQNNKREPVTQPPEAAIEDAPEPPPKKRRGRPKKSDKAKATTAAASDAVETPKAAKASKKDKAGIEDTDRKYVEIPPSDDDDEAPSPSPKRSALEVKDVNTAVPKEQPKEQDKEATDSKPANPVAKAGTPAALQRGAQYRVGLSKKSRIAPLLKIIRK